MNGCIGRDENYDFRSTGSLKTEFTVATTEAVGPAALADLEFIFSGTRDIMSFGGLA
jgi:hypothetical protein